MGHLPGEKTRRSRQTPLTLCRGSSSARRLAYASLPPGAQCPESQPEPVRRTDLNCHCMFVFGCLRGTGSLCGNLGQGKPTRRCQHRKVGGVIKEKKKRELTEAMTRRHHGLVNTFSPSYNLRGRDYSCGQDGPDVAE